MSPFDAFFVSGGVEFSDIIADQVQIATRVFEQYFNKLQSFMHHESSPRTPFQNLQSRTSPPAIIVREGSLLSSAQRPVRQVQRYGSLEGHQSPSLSERRPTKRTENHLRTRRKALKKIHDHEPTQDIKAVALRLMNNGNVARDHLASERTFLAYVRTSLGMASAGVALMQFLHLGSSTKAFSAPIGGTMVVTSIIVLLIGARRFFLVQRALVEGFYRTSFLDVILISLALGSLITGVFGIVLWGRYQRT